MAEHRAPAMNLHAALRLWHQGHAVPAGEDTIGD